MANDGLATATAGLVGAVPPDQPTDTLQADLFGAEVADASGVGELTEEGRDLRRGRGRPPGSRNRSTKEWTAFILSRYRSPLITLATLSNARPADVAAEFGITLGEALDKIISAAVSLAPYLHQKQPLAVQAQTQALFSVVINAGSAQGVADAMLIKPFENIEEIQEVIDAGADVSELDGRNE